MDNNPLESRVSAFNSDLSTQVTGDFDQTSVGLRVTMYETALENFTASPIYGFGNIASQHQVFIKTGITPPHLHHIFLHDLSSHGILGFLGICALLFTPFYVSLKMTKIAPLNDYVILIHHIITALILFTILCGMTDHLFNFKIALYLYCFVIVTLLTIQRSTFKSCPEVLKEA